MSKFAKLVFSTVTLLAIGLMLLGDGGEAVGQKVKKPEVKKPEVKKTDGPAPKVDDSKPSAGKVMLNLRVVERVKTDDNAIPDASIVISQNGKTIVGARSGSDGKWSGLLPVGTYSVAATKTGFRITEVKLVHESMARAETVHLYLKANGTDIKGDSTQSLAKNKKLDNIELFSFSYGRVMSVDAAKRTFVLRSTDIKGEFRDHKFMLRDNTVIIRGDHVGRFLKIEIREGDDVCISDQAAAGNLTSYIMVKEGTTKDSTLGYGISRAFVQLEYFGYKKLTLPVGNARVFINMKTSRAEDLRMGEHAIIIISGTKTLTHVFVDRR